jgi:hypothetical protein
VFLPLTLSLCAQQDNKKVQCNSKLKEERQTLIEKRTVLLSYPDE